MQARYNKITEKKEKKKKREHELKNQILVPVKILN